MPHAPEHTVEPDPAAVDPQQQPPEREKLLQTFKRNPLEGLGATAAMFMPNWIMGSRPEVGTSLGETVRSMIEFTPVVGDVMDLKEGMNFGNDLDPLERALAFFAGMGLMGGAGATVGMGAHSQMRTRHQEQVETLYEDLAATYRTTPLPGTAPAAIADRSRPTVPMKTPLEILSSVDAVSRRLRQATAATGIEAERLVFTVGMPSPRHIKVGTAKTMEQLSYALWNDAVGRHSLADQFPDWDADIMTTVAPFNAPGILEDAHPEKAAFAHFIYELGTLMINTGLYETASGPVTTHSGAFYDQVLTDWSQDLDPEIMGAATHALSIYTQAMDAGLIHGEHFFKLADQFEDGTLFKEAATPTAMSPGPAQMGTFLSLLGDLAQVVMRHGGPDLTMTPNMKWNSFYSTPDGRLLGTMNIHVLQDSRYVDPETGIIKDPAGLQAQLWKMDFGTLVGHFVRSMMAIEDGVTSVAVSETHRRAAAQWYPQMNRLINVVSERYGIEQYQVGAIISALSPRATWNPDNVNWAILGALEATQGTLDEASQLQELNEVRQLAGFPAVTQFKDYGSALGTSQAKVSQILAGMNPVEALRMLKTMAFMHNGLFPEGAHHNSPFGVAVITADTHAFRGITGFYHAVEPPWMKATMQVPQVNWLTGGSDWHSTIGADLVARLSETGGVSEEFEIFGGSVPAGAAVPMFAAERMYDAVVRAHVMAGELMGISAVEAQARIWQPVMEASSSMTGNKTVVWHDGVLKELEGRSPTSPSITDSLHLLDGKLIDPMSRHVDMFTIADTHGFEPGVGILVASGPGGLRVYADPRVPGVVDQLRTARPIEARPRLFVGKKEGLTIDPRVKPRPTKLDPVRFVPRISRNADLATVQRASIVTSPVGEFRQVTDPSTRPDIPDVHSPGNYIVIEIAQGDTASVQQILDSNSFPVKVTEAPLSHTAGNRRASARLTAAEVETGLHRRASENPLATQNWVMIPDDRRLLNRLRRNNYDPVASYVRDTNGETRRTWAVFGLTSESELLAESPLFWTADGQYNTGVMTPSAEGVSMGTGGAGTSFGIIGDPGTTEFSIQYAADEAVATAPGTQQARTVTPTRRTQLIVSLGSIPDPAMALRLWENLDLDQAVLSLSGYFHGRLYADLDGSTTGHPMVQVGEYSYTNGNERLTHRAQHSEQLIEDENYYTVWVPSSEAARLDVTHGVFPSKSTKHTATVERKSDNAVVIDGETTIVGAGESLDLNAEKLLQSKVDGEQIRVLAVTKDSATGRPAMLMAQSEEALRASKYWDGFSLAAIFKVSKRGTITGISNDAMAAPGTFETGIGPFRGQENLVMGTGEAIMTEEDVAGKELSRVKSKADSEYVGSGRDPVRQEPFQIETTDIYDPKYTAEINDVWASIELLLRYGATPAAIRTALDGHPLGASISGRLSNMGPLLARQQGYAGIDTPAYDHYDGRSMLDRAIREYHEGGDPTRLENFLLDAAGQHQSGHDIEAAKAKATTLDPELQRVYKEAARTLIGDYALFPDTEVSLLAGYRVHGTALDQKNHHTMVMHALGLWGALTERPGHVVPGNAMRDLPGIAWFRERHGGVVFPGVIALQGSLGIGARHSAAAKGYGAGGTYHAPNWSDVVSSRSDIGRSHLFDETGTAVPKNGIHIDTGMVFGHGDLEWVNRALRLSTTSSDARHKIMQAVKISGNAGDVGISMIAVHEFGHALHHAIVEMGHGHVVREHLARIIMRHGGQGTVRRELGRYAAGSWRETIAESFNMTMMLGQDAPAIAIEVTDMLWDMAYSPTGGAAFKETVEATTPSQQFGGPAEFPFWHWSLSGWESSELQQAQSRTTGVGDLFPMPPMENRGNLIQYLDWLAAQTGQAHARKRLLHPAGKPANWQEEDLQALFDA